MLPRNAVRSGLFAGLVCATLSLSSRPADAARIATALGTPGSAGWNSTCTVLGHVPNTPLPGGNGLDACTPGVDRCFSRVDIPKPVFPEATCSDETQGAFYVRPGIGADKNRWVIHLQGGSAARTTEEYEARWCGAQNGGFYRADKMSSDWDHDGVSNLREHAAIDGMQLDVAANEFAEWNHVFVYYCSSDAWIGQRQSMPLAGFEADASGHDILAAVRDMLRHDAPAWTAVDGTKMPDIDQATEIIFSGTSSGSYGALQNADWFLEPMTNAAHYLVLDGALDVSDTVLLDHDVWADVDGDGVGDSRYYSHRIVEGIADWNPGGYMYEADAFVDETCGDWYRPWNRMDRCSLFSTLLRFNLGAQPMIATPTFVRMDLADRVIRKKWTDHPNSDGESLLVGGRYGTPADILDHVRFTRETLVQMYADHDTVKGVFAPKCGTHVGLETLTGFGVETTRNTLDTPPFFIAPGTVETFEEALWSWINLGGPILPERRIDRPGVLGVSGC